jgi:5-methylcytosine-specific restriction enzyme subunit McrC
VGNLTIEILPKANQSIIDAHYWQQCLLEMLQYCEQLPIDSISKAPLGLDKSPLLTIYMDLFIVSIEKLLQVGLQKYYRLETKNSNHWRGQINFAKQIEKNWCQPQKVYSTQQIYNYDSVTHQLLVEALEIIQKVGYRKGVKRKAHFLLKHFPIVQKRGRIQQLMSSIETPPVHSPYYLAVELAKMLVLRYSPSLRTGDMPLLALLFDMNQLFERFVGIQLRRKIPKDWNIAMQQRQLFWQQKHLRPDILIQTPQQNYVLDTKWKILSNAQPSSDDLRQMYVYNHQFEAQKSILIYPKVSDLENNKGTYTTPIYLDGKPETHDCEVIFVSLLDKEMKLNTDLVRPILRALGIE